MTTEVILSSEAFGNETFVYESLSEALSGIARLVRSCKKQYEEDGVPREIKILIPSLEEGSDPA
jgi:hypothetical protein